MIASHSLHLTLKPRHSKKFQHVLPRNRIKGFEMSNLNNSAGVFFRWYALARFLTYMKLSCMHRRLIKALWALEIICGERARHACTRRGLSLICHRKAPTSTRSNSSSGSLRWVTHIFPMQGISNNSIGYTLKSPTLKLKHYWRYHKIKTRNYY